jgi:hypothetical protein
MRYNNQYRRKSYSEQGLPRQSFNTWQWTTWTSPLVKITHLGLHISIFKGSTVSAKEPCFHTLNFILITNIYVKGQNPVRYQPKKMVGIKAKKIWILNTVFNYVIRNHGRRRP